MDHPAEHSAPPLQRRLGRLGATAGQAFTARCEVLVSDGPDARELMAAARRSAPALTAALGSAVPVPDVSAGPPPSTVATGIWVDGRDPTTTALTLVAPAGGVDAAGLIGVARSLVTAAADGSAPAAGTAFADAAAWWNAMAGHAGTASVREFWRARATGWSRWPIAGSTDPTGEPYRPRRAASVLRPVPAHWVTAGGPPLSAWLLAAWQVVLRRLAGGAEIVVGVATDLRHQPELRTCVGPLTPYVPVPGAGRLDRTLAELAAEVAVLLRASAPRAGCFAWDTCVPDGRPDAALPFGYDHLVLPEWRTGAARVTVTDADARADRFGLRLSTRERAGAVELRVEYDPAAVAGTLAGSLADAVGALVDDAVRRPTAAVADLDLLGPRQREALRRCNGVDGSVPVSGSLCGAVVEHARRDPTAVAVVDGARRVTYRDLVSDAMTLAGRLRRLGVGPEVRVGVLLPRGVGLVTACLGVTAAGAAYVPLDPDHPVERSTRICRDAGVQVVVTDADSAARAPQGATLVDVDHAAAHAEPAVPLAEPVAAHPDQMLYVLHTSGSTGRPKGVMVTHGNVLRLLAGARDRFGFGPRDTWTLFHSMTFDFAVWELWGALAHGARLVVVTSEQARSPQALADVVDREGVTVLNQTPTAFRGLRDVLVGTGRRPGALRLVIFGGEALYPADVAPWLKAFGHHPALVNMYGITETTVHVTAHEVRSDPGRASVIGRPLPDLPVSVCDANGRPVPVGAVGELYVGGAGVSRGYLGEPGRTADRFRPDPEHPGRRVYLSGDLARWGADDHLEFVGRADLQVKVRGFRIEPGEVEACLLGHELVEQCAVVGRDDGDGTRLVAYVVLRAPQPVDQLREYVATRLPAHLVPSVFVPLATIPVSATGKVDRAALPALDRGRPHLTTGFVAAQTAAERTVAEVWADVLGVDRVGREDNYFALGGDSILSILVASVLARRGLRVEPRTFFEHPTVRDFAAAARPVTGPAGADAAAGPLPPAPGGLLPAQRWFFDQQQPHPGHWNQAWLFDAGGADPQVLARAVRRVVAHHPALRTRFLADPGAPAGWRSEVADEVPVGVFRTVPVRADVAWEDGLAEALRGVQDVDLAAGTPLRAVLVDGGPDRRRLALVAHHLVIDAVSWHIVLHDLHTAYGQEAAGGPVRLVPAGVAPAQWAAALAARSAAAAGDLDYWRRQAPPDGDAVPLDAPVRERVREADREHVEVVLDPRRSRVLLRDMPRVARVHTDDALVAAVARAVAAWTGRPYAHLDIEGQGRSGDLMPDWDLYRSVGWFTTVAPLLVRLPDGDDPESLLAAVTSQLHDFHHRALGYGVLRYLDPAHAATLAAQAPPAVSFNFVGRTQARAGRPDGVPAAVLGPAPERVPAIHHPDNRWPHLIDVSMTVYDEQLRITVHYGRHHHRRATVQALADGVLATLVALIDRCGGGRRAVPADFPLLAVDQRGLDAVLRRAAARAPRGAVRVGDEPR